MAQQSSLLRVIEVSSFLAKIPLFEDLSRGELASLAEIVETESMFAGEAVFHQGDLGDALYVIQSGSVSVEVSGQEVARLGPSDYLGEMSIIDELPRSAACVIVENAVLLRISRDDFNVLLHAKPNIALSLMRVLAKRHRALRQNIGTGVMAAVKPR